MCKGNNCYLLISLLIYIWECEVIMGIKVWEGLLKPSNSFLKLQMELLNIETRFLFY